MSYKPVVVALRRDAGVGLERQLQEVMRPFVLDPGDGGQNHACAPSSVRCDGWRVGGYWAGRYLSSALDHADLVDPIRFPAGSPLAEYVACSGGPKHLLDLERTRSLEEEVTWLRWPAFVAERIGIHGCPAPSTDRSPSTIRAEFDDRIARARGWAVTGTSLVTREGEWWEGDVAWPEYQEYLVRAGKYIDALDGDAWLVVLTVHY